MEITVILETTDIEMLKKKNFFQDHGQINYTIKLNYLLPHTFSLKRTLSNYNYSNSNTQI